MSEENKKVCPQCDNHCLADALRCGRGRKYFSEANEMGDRVMRETDENRDRREQDPGLEMLLRKCGHFLYHKCSRRGGQKRILRILAENASMSQKELQERLEIQAGSMSEIVMKLEAKGFLTRAKDEKDKRMTTLTITEAGLDRIKEEEAEEKKEGQDLFEALTKEEQETLEGLLKKLTSDWEDRFQQTSEERRGRCGGGMEGHFHHRGRHGDGRGRHAERAEGCGEGNEGHGHGRGRHRRHS